MPLHPGVNEIEWLADLKPLAEEIGSSVLGRPIRWSIETSVAGSADRSDVRIEAADGTLLYSGEAKRPDSPQGQHPLVTAVVDDAVGKAQAHGVPFCFTTNFHQIGVFDAGPGLHGQPMRRLQGNVIELIDRTYATTDMWWGMMTSAERRAASQAGLRELFERLAAVSAGAAPTASIDAVALDYFTALTDALLDPLAREFIAVRATVDPAIQARALVAGLNLDKGQDCRYLVAQGIAEVLSAALFHRLLRDHFPQLQSLLGGTTPGTAARLSVVVQAGLSDAVRVSGDYKPILVISDVARWVLDHAPVDAVGHWNALLVFVDHLDLGEISSDILGSIFERLISPDRRRELGQHYTQPRLARAMAAWGVTDQDVTVLDPTCGAGTFLVETYARHAEFGLTHDEILGRTFGNDIDGFAVHLASINLVTRRIRHGLNHPMVREGDAFGLGPGTSMLHVYAEGGTDDEIEDVFLAKPTLVIGNPPYARANPNEMAAVAHLNGLGLFGADLPTYAGINYSAWFVLLADALLAPGGRMAFVMPTSVLQNDNLDSWRRWLRRRYDLTIWHTEADIWFSDARVNPCVLLLTPRPAGTTGDFGTVHFVDVMSPVDGVLHQVDGVPSPSANATVRDLTDAPGDADLFILGTRPAVLAEFEDAPAACDLVDLPGYAVAAGQKLGHAVFRLEDQAPRREAVIRDVRGLDTHLRLNKRHLSPLLTGPKDLDDGLEYVTDWLLITDKARPTSGDLQRYVRLAESQDVHLQPSVRGRTPWWSVRPKLVDIAVPLHEGFRHQVGWLDPRRVVTNNFNTVCAEDPAHPRTDTEIVAASLASAFGTLSMLYVSTVVGCEGARHVLLSRFNLWPVLDPASVTNDAVKKEIVFAYRAYRAFTVSEFDVMPRDEEASLRRLTVAVAAGAIRTDFTDERAVALAAGVMDECRSTVVRRRVLEARALAGRTRAARSNGPTLSRRVRDWCAGHGTYGTAVQAMVVGPDVSRLRDVHAIENPDLFQQNRFDVSPAEELALVQVLGPRFEAAWPDPKAQVAELAALITAVDDLFDSATSDLLPTAPQPGAAGRETWDRLRDDLYAALRRRLQADVREEIA